MKKITRTDTLITEPGQEIELEINSLAFGGQGVSRLNGFVVFVDNALPGQRVLARITMTQKRHARAEAIEILSPSPDQTAPFCLHVGFCGGCAWQTLSYQAQLKWKRYLVQNTLTHLAKLSNIMPAEVTPSPQTLYFRNKMELSFAGPGGPELELGLHRRGSNLLVPIKKCHLQPGPGMDLAHTAKEWCRSSGLSAYNPDSGQGFWRFMVTRTSQKGELLINFITYPRPAFEKTLRDLADHLMRRFPEITGIVHSTRRNKLQTAVPEKIQWWSGRNYIEEGLGGLTFQISAGAFFQTNTQAATLLYDHVLNMADLKPRANVLDLYCGAGALSLWLAAKAHARVTGVDIYRESVAAARKNAELNNLNHCRFYAADVAKFLAKREKKPDLLLANPPRSGLSAQAVQSIIRINPPRIIYVSCNPATQARDILLLQTNYKLKAVQPVDIFPHNPHVESVILLESQ